MWWRSIAVLGVIFGIMLALVPNIIYLLSLAVCKCFGGRIPYAPFGWTAVALVLILWTLLAYGHFVGRFRSVVNNVEYASGEVPQGFDGYRICQISDLHIDSFDDNPQALQKIVEKVNSLSPDIILFTGDLTTAQMGGISKHEASLKSLHAKDGTVSILGNHDFFIYCPEYRNDAERSAAADTLTEYERTVLGWKVLRNESFLLHEGADSIAIAGVDNINGNQGFSTIQKGDLKKAMAGLDGIFTVLMSHDPSHWEAEVLPKSHAQITLSGHTHAGQVRLFGWSVANLVFRECDGRYDRDGRMLYVNAGIGCTARVRIGCPSEITLITLKRD